MKQNHKEVAYKSIEQQLRDDAEKYVKRATDYLNSGKINCAIGCLEKARNKIKQADLFKIDKNDPFFGISQTLADMIAKSIIVGTNETKDDAKPKS